MSPFPSPLGAVVFGTVVVSATYFYVWWQYRECYAATWSVAWAMHALRYSFLLLTTAHPDAAGLRLAYQLSDVAATLLLAWGTVAFLGIRPNRALLSVTAALITADVVWLGVATFSGVPDGGLALPNRVLLGLIGVWLGGAMLFSHKLAGIGGRAAGLALAFAGLERIARMGPGLVPPATPYGHFAYLVAEAIVALGLFLAYFEQGRGELLASEERFRRLTENAPDIIVRYRVARPRTCEYCSPAIIDVLGYRPEQLVGDPSLLPRLIHPDDRRLLLRAVRRRDRTRSGLLLRLVRADQAIVWAEFRFSYATGRGGALTTVDAVVRDVSERVRLQEHLVQSQKMELVAQLAGGIAHEFNNLIMAVNGHATFAAEALPPRSPVRQDVEVVIESAGKAAALTRQLLAFSRRQILRREPIDVNEQVRQFCSVASHLVRPSVSVHMELENGLPWANADAGQIQEVLATLASNASDAMPHGGALRIGTERVSVPAGSPDLAADARPGDYVRLTVSDQGVGMSDEVRSHLFEPFYTTKGFTKGTGLGLASVYGIVKQHQGMITVSSQDGTGTKFCAYIPVAGDATPAAAPPADDVVA